MIKICPPSYIHTKRFAFQPTIFTFCISIPLYIPTHNPSCHFMSNILRQKLISFLPSIFQKHLHSSNIVIPFNTNSYELATTREGGLHFILSDNSNYDFDIEVKCCGLVSFLKVVIDYGCLESWCGKAISVFFFFLRIKEKDKDKFNINFYSTIFFQSFFFFFYLNQNIIMDMSMQFIIVAFYDKFITNEVT